MFLTNEGVNDFINWLQDESGYSASEKKTVLEKLTEWLLEIVDRIKEIISEGHLNGVAKDFAEAEAERYGDIRKQFLEALNEIKSAEGDKKSTADGGVIKLSLMNDDSFTHNVDEIINMTDEVALKNKEEGNFVKVMKNTPSVILENVKDSADYEVIIRFDALYLAARAEGVLEGHYHNLAEKIKKLPEFLGKPDAIVRMNTGRLNILTTISTPKGKNGIISMELNTVKDINSNYKKYNLVVSVFSAKDNYTKNNLINNGVKVEYKKEDLSQVNPQLYEWLAIVNDKSFNNNIPQNGNVVNSYDMRSGSKKFSYAATDAKYLAAVENGDTETAQKMVDEAAKSKGYTIKAYHGGDKFFTVFGKGNKTSQAPEGVHFFTSNKDVAYSYTTYKRDVNTDVNSYPVYKQVTREGTFEENRVAHGGVYSSFLKLENPYIVDFEGEYYSRKIDGRDINEIAVYARDNGYDGVIAKNIKDPGDMGDANWEREPSLAVADDYIVFSTNQIKSAETVTYDENGKVIPLSERFKDDNEDIRFSYAEESTTSIKEQLKNNTEMLNSMNIVGRLNENKVFYNKQGIVTWIVDKLKNTGDTIQRKNFGDIVFDIKRIRNGLRYFKTNEERLALALVPDVLRKGVEIGYHSEHKDRIYDTFTFAAPIEINGVRGNMAVVVRASEKNYYKVHRLLLPDGSQFVFNKKGDISERAGGANESSGLSPTENISTNSIPDSAENVKTSLDWIDFAEEQERERSAVSKVTELEKINEELRAQIRHPGVKHVVSQLAVQKVARKLKSGYMSKINFHVLADELSTLYGYIANENGLSWANVQIHLESIATKILDESKYKNPDISARERVLFLIFLLFSIAHLLLLCYNNLIITVR